MVLLRLGHEFRDAASEEVDFRFGGERRKGVEGGGLGSGGWGGEEGLGVGGEVLAAVGELKHSGRTMREAPALEASRTRARALARLAVLSAPGGMLSDGGKQGVSARCTGG